MKFYDTFNLLRIRLTKIIQTYIIKINFSLLSHRSWILRLQLLSLLPPQQAWSSASLREEVLSSWQYHYF